MTTQSSPQTNQKATSDRQPLHQVQQPLTMAQSGYPVKNAADKCIKGEREVEKNTVRKPAGRQHTGNEDGNGQNDGRHGSIETQQASVTAPWYDPDGRDRNCDHCGREYLAKRDTSKYCRPACRVAAYKKRHNIED